MGGETAERLSRFVLRRLTITVSTIGLGAAPIPTLARTILLQLRWAVLLRRQPALLITDITQRAQQGRTIFVADAHRDNGQRSAARADEKLTAFLELERVTRESLCFLNAE